METVRVVWRCVLVKLFVRYCVVSFACWRDALRAGGGVGTRVFGVDTREGQAVLETRAWELVQFKSTTMRDEGYRPAAGQ